MSQRRADRRSAFITGGTGSIGRAMLELFVRDFDVTFTYNQNEALASELASRFDAKPLKLDLAVSQFELIPWTFDVLVNNAAINVSRVRLADVTSVDLLKTFATNFFGPFRLCQLALPYMERQKYGRIVNINSLYGLRASVGNGPYTSSKHALSGLTKTIAREYAGSGITSNEICPGAVESELMTRIAQYAEVTRHISISEYLKQVAASSPSGRMTMPIEVAEIALFLAGDKASHVNGVSVAIDGGISS